MKETRIKKIFDRLNESFHYIPSEELATELNVSSKTIRNEIKEIERIFQSHGGRIDSKAGHGYRLEIVDMESFKEFVSDEWLSYAYVQDDYTLKSTRAEAILKILLRNREYIKAEELCELIGISKSQLSQDLTLVRSKLEEYHLTLESKPHYGLKIIGPEMAMRLCIANVFGAMGSTKSSNLHLVLSSNDETTNQIRTIVLDVFTKHGYMTSDLVFKNLVIHLFVALERIKIQESIRMDEQTLKTLQGSSEYIIAHDIVEQLASHMHIEIPEDEKGYVCMHLAGKRIFESDEIGQVITSDIDEIVSQMILRVKKDLSIDLSKDLELRVALGLHLNPLLKRIRYRLTLKNPLLEEIKKHKRSFIVAAVATAVIEEKYQTNLSDDEVAYFALHFYVALERLATPASKKRILLVCSTGKGTAKLLQYRFTKEFDGYIESLKTIDAMSLYHGKIEDVDLIVTTIPIQVKTQVPIIQISSLLDDEDISLIRHQMEHSESSIAKYFDRRLFFSDVLVSSKEEILQMMCQRLSEAYELPLGLYESVMLRESYAPTEFGNEIAIPHPNQSFSQDTVVSVAILKKPIIWNQKRVQLVFLLSYGANEESDLEEFFEKSAQFLINPEDIKKVIASPDYDRFISLINKN